MKTVLVSMFTALSLCAGAAHAQFSVVPAPATSGLPAPSAADHPQAYKQDFARHLYQAYPARIYKGQLPPLLYSVMITETQIDTEGGVVEVSIRRPPAVPAVAPWVVQMIKRAAPFPAPARMGAGTVMEIWLVDRSGNFQLDTLTEGQR
jgi:hypothetical protein